MSDLISRKKVIDILEKEKSLKCGYDADIAILSIEKGIRELPTAYSVDNVVEELEKSSKWVNETNEYCDDDGNDYIPLSKAIEIIKQGCVSDDACEWNFEDDNLMTGCGDYFNLYDNCTDKFKFCPTCGKKIKVVD